MDWQRETHLRCTVIDWWISRVKNEEVFERMGVGKEIWRTLIRRTVQMIGHSLRHVRMIMLLIEEIIKGKSYKRKGLRRDRLEN